MSATTTTTASTTHLLWVGRWIEVSRVHHPGDDGWAWRFKNGRDAADWLLHDRPTP